MRLNDWEIYSPSGRVYRLPTSLSIRPILSIPRRLKHRLHTWTVLWPTMSRDVPSINLLTPTPRYILPVVTENVYTSALLPPMRRKPQTSSTTTEMTDA